MEKKVDDLLAELNAQSAQLPGAQPMRHTVEELLGHALINEREDKHQSNYVYQHNPDAVRLLATKGFDLIKTSEDIMKLSVDSQVDKSEKFQNTDLQGYINHHHDMIVETSVQETRQWIENDVRDLQSRWMCQCWEDIASAANAHAEMEVSQESIDHTY